MAALLTVEALAGALEAAAASLRGALNPARAEASAEVTDDVLARARALHDKLGRRQAEVLSLLSEAGEQGETTGTLSRRMSYDQPNVYLTLRGLVAAGMVIRDAKADPHRYRLAPILMGPGPS